MRNLLLGLSFLGASTSAVRADQCQTVDHDAAVAAEKVLKTGLVLSYCEPCHDAPPAKAPTVGPASVKVHPSVVKGMDTVALDGKDVDLAYTYVQTGKTTWTNVGLMVGCGATNVTSFVSIGGKPMVPPGMSSSGDIHILRERQQGLVAEVNLVNARVDLAVQGVANAQNEADRAVAKAKLEQLRKEKAAMELRLTTANAELARAERQNGKQINKQCLNNPLAKGC